MRGFRSTDKMHFRYHVDWIDNEDKTKKIPVHRPKIEIVLRKFSERYDPKTNPEFRTHGLVDSGADICFIPREIAEILQLDLDKETKKETTGANGKFWTFRAKMYLEVVDKGKRIGIDMVEVAVLEKDPDDAEAKKNILIGRRGLFDKYEITFIETSLHINFKKISEKRGH